MKAAYYERNGAAHEAVERGTIGNVVVTI